MGLSKWGKVEPDDFGGFIEEEGTYDFLCVDAWDSICALKGTNDFQKGTTRYIGMVFKVVGPEGNPQMGRLHTVRLWLNSEENQSRLLGALKCMNITISDKFDDVDPNKTPLSTGEIIGQYAKIVVHAEAGDDNKIYYKSAAWDFFEPSDNFANNPREIFPDKESAASIRHYENELSRKKKKDDDDDLPF